MKRIFLFLVLLISSNTSASLIDFDDFTRIPELGIDVYDVDHFYNLTQLEVYDAVDNLDGEWRFASIEDVRPIYELLDESEYLSNARFLFSFYEAITGKYVTGGRVTDMFPDSTYPHFNYLWGFGDGILSWDQLQQPIYNWSSFSMGWDMAETRFSQQGAWVVRNIPTTVAEPNSFILFILAFMVVVAHNNTRRGGQQALKLTFHRIF
jgi:hypothetical protein